MGRIVDDLLRYGQVAVTPEIWAQRAELVAQCAARGLTVRGAYDAATKRLILTINK